MAKIFVSHSAQDRSFVDREIIELLHSHGLETWYSKDDILSAAHWERNIVSGLKACDLFLVVLSPRSAQSEWVRDEVHWAIQNRSQQIIPVLMETCNLEDFHLRMPRIQFVDFRSDPREAGVKLLHTLGVLGAIPTSRPTTHEEVYCLNGHAAGVEGVVFCASGRRFLSAADDKTARLWDVATGAEIRRFSGHKGVVSSLAISVDDQFLLTGSSDRTMRLWEVETGRELRRYEGFKGWVLSLAFSADGRHALSGCGDTTLRWWDVETGQELRRLQASSSGWVHTVAISSDGRFAISGTGHQWQGGEWIDGSEHAVRLWDLQTGRLLQRFQGHANEVWSVDLSPDDRRALSASPDKSIRLWHVKSGKQIRSLEGHAAEVYCVAFSPDARRAVSGGADETVRLWDLDSGQELHCFLGHTDAVNSVTFSPDGSQVLSCSADATVRLWTVPQCKASDIE